MRGVADVLKIVRYVAVAADPLPRPPGQHNRRPVDGKLELLGWALIATLLVAGSSYWMGIQSLREESVSNLRASTAPKMPALLSQPMTAQPSLPRFSQVARPANSEAIVAEPGPIVTAPVSKDMASVANAQIKKAEPATAVEAAARQKPDKSGESTAGPNHIWPVQKVEGASGRLVRIGHFATASEAEKGWETVLRKYPGMQRLKSLPVPIKSLRDGHLYYRLQVGTTSQAHSDVVCQRMQDMDQSCTVIGSEEGGGESAT